MIMSSGDQAYSVFNLHRLGTQSEKALLSPEQTPKSPHCPAPKVKKKHLVIPARMLPTLRHTAHVRW